MKLEIWGCEQTAHNRQVVREAIADHLEQFPSLLMNKEIGDVEWRVEIPHTKTRGVGVWWCVVPHRHYSFPTNYSLGDQGKGRWWDVFDLSAAETKRLLDDLE